MNTAWKKNILQNFNQASSNYDSHAKIQKFIANLLAIECSKKRISSKICIDLGAGTGLLANILEELKINQSVIRLDASQKMLDKNPRNSSKQLWDLNQGFPNTFSKPPDLIASSFVLHWLNQPEVRIKEWFSALAPQGWLALAVPIAGSFPEWHKAASLAKVNCTAINFPSNSSLFNSMNQKNIKYKKIVEITQTATTVSSLLKPLIAVGGQATNHKSLTVSEWRKIENSWSFSENNNNKNLTWLIQILLAQK